jgi:transposase InsO family protein
MLKMRNRTMTEQQRLIYGARIRLGWFQEAERLGNVREACLRLGVPRRTYYYWHDRWTKGDKTLRSLFDQPKTPKSCTNDPSEELVSLVVQLRLGLMYGEDALSTVLARDYGVNISNHGVHNILHRAGLLEKRKKEPRAKRRLSDYPYCPGEVLQLDVKHWKKAGYQYDIIDCCTRIKYKRIYAGYNVNNTVDFLEKALRFYTPAFPIKLVQMDNGPEFTNEKMFSRNQTKPSKQALPERWLVDHDIDFRHIPPASPNLNGRIERPHGVDKWRFKHIENNEHTFEKLKSFCLEDCLDYNTYRPHSMLGNMTPLEFLNSLAGFESATIDTSVLYV